MEDRLLHATSVQEAAIAAVERQVQKEPVVNDILSILVNPPARKEKGSVIYDRPAVVRKPVKRNYLEIEARNQTLGRAGENFILEFEEKRLWQGGRKDLASRIQHVSDTQSDQLGFDISSFELDGRDKLIEVKTTQFGERTPFFASKNEVNVSVAREREYHLYRLFNFTKQPKLFILPGSLRESCILDPTQYSATVR